MNNLQDDLLPTGCESYVARDVHSGQYYSNFGVAVEAARQYLNTVEADQHGGDLVILDIDETPLLNLPYYGAQNYGVKAWNEASVNAWVNHASMPALDPMLSVYSDLGAQNQTVGFIKGPEYCPEPL